MLDIKSQLVLKILIKECPNGAYKVVESSDIISALPPRYRVDSDRLTNVLNYLERQDCISIKYDDDGVYCLCVLPFGFETCENDVKKGKVKKTSPNYFVIILLSSLFALIGGFLGALLVSLL